MPQEIRAMPNSVIHYDHAKTSQGRIQDFKLGGGGRT